MEYTPCDLNDRIAWVYEDEKGKRHVADRRITGILSGEYRAGVFNRLLMVYEEDGGQEVSVREFAEQHGIEEIFIIDDGEVWGQDADRLAKLKWKKRAKVGKAIIESFT